jgi:hypothetical protein
VLAAVTQHGYLLKYGGNSVRNDKDVVLAAVMKTGTALKHARWMLRCDKEVVLAAVKQNGAALQHASPMLRNDRNIVLAAVAQDGTALQYAEGHLKQDKDIAIAAVTQNGAAFSTVDVCLQSERDVLEAAVRSGTKHVYADALNFSATTTKLLFSSQMISLATACCPKLLKEIPPRLITKQCILACITASLDTLKYVQYDDLALSVEVEVARHFVLCCKTAGLDRDACTAKAAAFCKRRSLCIKIWCAAYFLY